MSTQTRATTVQAEIVVDAPLERAFSVFTAGFGRFKPPEHNMLAVEIAETVFEPRVGGYLYDRGVDGSECRWARVLAYEPPHRVLLSWDISPQWQPESDPAKTSEWRCASSRRRRSARASSSSTATSSATAPAGKRYATASPPPTAGRSTCGASPRS